MMNLALARPTSKVSETVLRVETHEAYAMLSFVTGEKVQVRKLCGRGSGNHGLTWVLTFQDFLEVLEEGWERLGTAQLYESA